jgi:hypothetical protein
MSALRFVLNAKLSPEDIKKLENAEAEALDGSPGRGRLTEQRRALGVGQDRTVSH